AAAEFLRVSMDADASDRQQKHAQGRIDELTRPAYHDEELFQRRLLALRMFEEGKPVGGICEAIGVSPFTLNKYLTW
ncbi:hypothetical protein, partial [Klebsiella pneumoniae]|uniref:hypothetical protein n=1 Tax=Klebsiella pneumoniae TaxID=573 RepID=UPI001E3DFCDA